MPSTSFALMRMEKFKMESKQLRSGAGNMEASKTSKAAIKKPSGIKKEKGMKK